MRMEISAMEEAPRPDLLERKGSLYLRSNHTMQYDRPTLVSGWHQSREAEPKDYDVTALPLGKKNMSRSTYTRIGNVENDIWDTSTEDHLSQIHLQKDYEVKDVPKLMINEGNIDTVNIKSLRMPCFTCIESSYDRMLWVHSNSFQIRMPHLESTPDLLRA
ncbi:hypothetical protein FKM82_000595 [Ascaphus truei]